MNSLSARPAWMISRAIALASEMSLPTSRPSQRSANSAAARSMASSHVAGRRTPSSRTSGCVRRCRPSSIGPRLALPSVRLHELADAVEAQLELVLRLGVREPDEPLPRLAEGGSGQHRDARLVQQARRQVALVEAGCLDVGKRVERALRQLAPHAGNRI